MTNWEKLLETPYNKYHCKTTEIAEKFIRITINHGNYWKYYLNDIVETKWEKYKENTCYSLIDNHMVYGNIIYSSPDFNILNVEHFLKERPPFKLFRSRITK